jgi:hypothetical protein
MGMVLSACSAAHSVRLITQGVRKEISTVAKGFCTAADGILPEEWKRFADHRLAHEGACGDDQHNRIREPELLGGDHGAEVDLVAHDDVGLPRGTQREGGGRFAKPSRRSRSSRSRSSLSSGSRSGVLLGVAPAVAKAVNPAASIAGIITLWPATATA